MCFFTENASNFSYNRVGRLQRALGIWELAVLDKSQSSGVGGWGLCGKNMAGQQLGKAWVIRGMTYLFVCSQNNQYVLKIMGNSQRGLEVVKFGKKEVTFERVFSLFSKKYSEILFSLKEILLTPQKLLLLLVSAG